MLEPPSSSHLEPAQVAALMSGSDQEGKQQVQRHADGPQADLQAGRGGGGRSAAVKVAAAAAAVAGEQEMPWLTHMPLHHQWLACRESLLVHHRRRNTTKLLAAALTIMFQARHCQYHY